MSRRVIVHPDQTVLAEAAAARAITALLDAQSHRSPVHWVLTGGSVGIATLAAMGRSPVLSAIDWSQVHLWWGDERFLPAGNNERNEVQAHDVLIDQLKADFGLPTENVHTVPASDSKSISSVDEAAEHYAQELSAFAEGDSSSDVRTPDFDLLLLGMGPDIHIASLFPGHEALGVVGSTTTAVRNSPKPPPERVSLTFEAINHSRRVWIVAGGAEKAEAVSAVIANKPAVEAPAAHVHGQDETLLLIDTASAT